MALDVAGTRYHLVRSVDEATAPVSGLHDFVQSTCALLLGCFFLRTVRDTTNKIVDYVLLTNFPDLPSHWCIVQDGQRTSRLQDTQNYYMRLAFLATALLRWPGRYLFGLPLFECIRYIIILYTSCQLLLIGFLLIIHGLAWIGVDLATFTGWDTASSPTVPNSKNNRTVHFESPAAPKYRGPNMPRKHPRSVGMGRFLQCLPPGALERANFYSPRKRKQEDPEMQKHQRLGMGSSLQYLPQGAFSKANFFSPRKQNQKEPEKHEPKAEQPKRSVQELISTDLFITRELNTRTHQTETIIYHAITTREKFCETSFEEMRIEHYGRVEGSSIVSLPSLDADTKAAPLPMTGPQVETEEAEDEDPARSTLTTPPPPIIEPQVEAEDNSISELLKSSMRQIALPSWLSSRMSRDQSGSTASASPAVTEWESPSMTLVPSSTPPGLPPISAQEFWGRKFT